MFSTLQQYLARKRIARTQKEQKKIQGILVGTICALDDLAQSQGLLYYTKDRFFFFEGHPETLDTSSLFMTWKTPAHVVYSMPLPEAALHLSYVFANIGSVGPHQQKEKVIEAQKEGFDSPPHAVAGTLPTLEQQIQAFANQYAQGLAASGNNYLPHREKLHQAYHHHDFKAYQQALHEMNGNHLLLMQKSQVDVRRAIRNFNTIYKAVKRHASLEKQTEKQVGVTLHIAKSIKQRMEDSIKNTWWFRFKHFFHFPSTTISFSLFGQHYQARDFEVAAEVDIMRPYLSRRSYARP